MLFLEGRTRADRARSRAAHEGRLGRAGVRGGGAPAQPADRRAHASPSASTSTRAADLRRRRRRARRRDRERPALPGPLGPARRAALDVPREHRRACRERAAHLVHRRVLRPARSACRRSSSCPGIEDVEVLEEFLWSAAARTSRSGSPPRGEKRRMLELAERNAELALRHDALVAERTRARRAGRSRSCARRSTSRRCRCASSASTSPTSASRNRVASMVVFEEAVPRSSPTTASSRSATREGQDDFRSIAEAVRAPLRPRPAVEEEGYDRSFATLPNLVLIDGGKGQLTAALEAMAEFDLPRVAVARLAKREEEVYVPGRARRSTCRGLAGEPPAAADPRRGAPLRARLPPPAPGQAADRLPARPPPGGRRQAAPGAGGPLRRRRAAAGGEPRGARVGARDAAEGRPGGVRAPAPRRRRPRRLRA